MTEQAQNPQPTPVEEISAMVGRIATDALNMAREVAATEDITLDQALTVVDIGFRLLLTVPVAGSAFSTEDPA